MSDPVEAVASALYNFDYKMVGQKWEGLEEDERQYYRESARAALAALPGEPVAWAFERNVGPPERWLSRVDYDKPEDCERNRNIRPLYASPPLPSREAIANILFNERDPFRAAENILALFGARTGPEK